MEKQLSVIKKKETEVMLNGQEVAIYKSLSGQLINTVENEDLFEAVRGSVMKCFALTGYKTQSADDIGFMITAIVNELKTSYKALRQEEISIAFERGVMKDYGEYMGLSAVSFCGFIKAYSISEQRKNAMKQIRLEAEMENEEKTPPTDEEIKAMFLSRLEELFEKHKDGQSLSIEECSFMFDRLWYEKIITMTEELRAELKAKAFDIAVGEMKSAPTKDRWEVKKLKQSLQDFKEKGTEVGRVKVIAKYLSLLYWFDGIAEMELSISEIINEN